MLSLSPAEQAFLLRVARRALELAATQAGQVLLVQVEDCPPGLRQAGACFVTLTCQGKLRGCVGNVLSREPLCQAVATSTRNAAYSDPRFPPLSSKELEQVRIEISVLSEPRPLSYGSPAEMLAQLEPGRHGVVLRYGARTATFLPKVWEQLPDKAQFLDRLAEKAGLAASAWREPKALVLVYEVESFAEA